MRKYLLSATLVLMVMYSMILTGCGGSDLHSVNTTLNKAARIENAAATSNHNFYEAGIYGAVGSAQAIAIRQKAATVIHDSNEKLIVALNLAKQLTPATFEAGKLAVLQALAEAGAGLHVGNQQIDLVLQSIATVINQVVVLVQAFKSADLWKVAPLIRSIQMREVTV